MPKPSNAQWITRTALFTALVLVAQFVGKMLPTGMVIFGPFSLNQLVTGSLVNLMLILAASVVGLWSGVTCGIISSVLAALMGMTPVPFIVPAIALGNAVIAIVAWLFFQKYSGIANRWIGVIVGAVLKCGFLWISIPVILRMISGIPEKQVAMLSIMFSWPQFITASIGGILAIMIYPALKKAL